MSRQNAASFLANINVNKNIRDQLLDGPATTKAWVNAASTAGYEVTADDLRSVTEQLAGKALTADNCVEALRGMFEAELTGAELEGVTGGAGTASAPPPRLTGNVAVQLEALAGGLNVLSGAGEAFVRDGGPMFPKDGFEFGGNVSNPVSR